MLRLTFAILIRKNSFISHGRSFKNLKCLVIIIPKPLTIAASLRRKNLLAHLTWRLHFTIYQSYCNKIKFFKPSFESANWLSSSFCDILLNLLNQPSDERSRLPNSTWLLYFERLTATKEVLWYEESIVAFNTFPSQTRAKMNIYELPQHMRCVRRCAQTTAD